MKRRGQVLHLHAVEQLIRSLAGWGRATATILATTLVLLAATPAAEAFVKSVEYVEIVLDAAVPGTETSNSANLTLVVTGPRGAVATITHDGVLLATAVKGNQAGLDLSLGAWVTDMETVTVTVTGFNMVPWITNLSVSLEAEPEVEPEVEPEAPAVVPGQVILQGNFPNPFHQLLSRSVLLQLW